MNARNVSFRGISYTVATVDPKKDDLRLLWRDERGERLGTLEAAKRQIERQRKKLLLATNAGIYDKTYRPLGLHVENGRTLVPLNKIQGGGGNFQMRPNGVFALTTGGQALVRETQAFGANPPKLRLATQSGPLLVIGGRLHPVFREGSFNRNIRNGVGVTKGGQIVFALSHLPVNFWDFASLFRDSLGCPDALYLDGAISGMLCPQARCDRPGFDNFVGIFVVSG